MHISRERPQANSHTSTSPSVLALAGGVGGAKLAQGLQAVLHPGELSVIVNTADDFHLWGLHISPDLDTVMYTLAGIANPETGWGVAGETWASMEMLARYGRDTWFRLGDRDLATHILRTQMLNEGLSLTHITSNLTSALSIPSQILPMCDETVETLVETEEGTLAFQDYFVRRRHADHVLSLTFQGIETAHPTPQVLNALRHAQAIIFCPSNPFVSIGPILAVPGFSDALRACPAPKVAVSPIVGGAALKGPAASMMSALGHEVSPYGVALLYRGIINAMIIDELDREHAPRIRDLGMAVLTTATVMQSNSDRARLASETLSFIGSLKPPPQTPQ